MVSRQVAIDWVNKYGEAWSSQDPDKIVALYTEDAPYVERPYDPDGGIYRGHDGIRNYWLTHVQVREREIKFRQLEDKLVFDPERQTAVAQWEACFEVAREGDTKWKRVQFLQIAVLQFAADGRVKHFEEWWHTRSLQHAEKGLRDPRARRPRAGVKRRVADLRGRTATYSTLWRARLGPFAREALADSAKMRQRATKKQSVVKKSADGPAQIRPSSGYVADEPRNTTAESVPSASPSAAKNPVQKELQQLASLGPSKNSDMVEWYRQSCTRCGIALESDVAGVPFLQPLGAFLWQEVQRWLDAQLAKLGVLPVCLPRLAHKSGSDAETPAHTISPLLEARSSTEVLLFTIMGKQLVKSKRDLPLALTHWSSALSPEAVKRPLPLLRSRDLPWQEGHAALASEEQSVDFANDVEAVYVRLCRELLAVSPRTHVSSYGDEEPVASNQRRTLEVPVLPTRSPDLDSPGEGCSPAVEVASIERVDESVTKSFNIKYQAAAENGKCVEHLAYLTSFSFTLRGVAAALCAHGDDGGFVVPPRMALLQVVLIPFNSLENWKARKNAHGQQADVEEGGNKHQQWCRCLFDRLQGAQEAVEQAATWASQPLRAQVDVRADLALNKRMRGWLTQSVGGLTEGVVWSGTLADIASSLFPRPRLD
eukprot:TRINITY_DN20922_c0_g1_i4.p1 TRINITY_DN20922_c0_g1~~TRINITY_DN20922_c0_g1_i4.p1  ORF type:complete len:654 (+),score=88.17 TRINITY_DN20922_c0_g1_i4:69-2030(+)